MVMVAVMSGKGGVGKSSISIMLSTAMSERGKTLLLDFDLCGPSVASGLGIKEKIYKGEKGLIPAKASENLYILSMALLMKESDSVIWRGPKKMSVLSMFYESADGFDNVVIDMPPGISEEHGFLVGKDISVLIATTPQNISLGDSSRAIDFCISNGIQILGLVENMSGYCCESCGNPTNIFGARGGERLAMEMGVRFICELKIDPLLCEALDEGKFLEKCGSIESYIRLRRSVLEITNI
ncbi:MRP-like ATP binding protein [Encephalitozoon intestinalis ATCC 50506]|uniref:MRP-like ATP binding protein n=1 Tax=Encephalitozoon intestinalis (strain ATCC 50506) TaxID=876142 RepID=E0S8K9_ENCIT|nr:MRP-like ATP binding protein [Encephalitozoon intestinalis ATCC 50506]ADM12003.1 MRP-like ATP binding protein [Encephalitozoon intestinalis ATCC 50506]UTX45791.1 MinD ATPase [Encephalitozoon intestinalis]